MGVDMAPTQGCLDTPSYIIEHYIFLLKDGIF